MSLEDYYYGYMLYEYRLSEIFLNLYQYDEGFVLQMPEIDISRRFDFFQARTKEFFLRS